MNAGPAPAVKAPAATSAQRTRRAWSPQRQWTVMALALLTVVVEILGQLEWVPALNIGRFFLSPSLIPAVALVMVVGRRAMGRARDDTAEVVFWAAAAIGLLMAGARYVADGHGLDVIGLLGVGLDEETVYRFAVPLVVAGALTGWGVRSRVARTVGFGLGGVWFVFLPGHQAQMDTVFEALPFIAFAVLAALVVYRTGALLAVMAVHACTDLVNILAFQGQVGGTERMLALACLYLLMVMAYGFRATAPVTDLPPAAPDGPSEDEVVIDLRDHVLADPPAVEEPDRPPVVAGGSAEEHRA